MKGSNPSAEKCNSVRSFGRWLLTGIGFRIESIKSKIVKNVRIVSGKSKLAAPPVGRGCRMGWNGWSTILENI